MFSFLFGQELTGFLSLLLINVAVIFLQWLFVCRDYVYENTGKKKKCQSLLNLK